MFSRVRIWMELQQVAGLAAQDLADRFQGGEADGTRISGLENRQVGERDVDAFGKFGQSSAGRGANRRA
jgi:hypothetical protein